MSRGYITMSEDLEVESLDHLLGLIVTGAIRCSKSHDITPEPGVVWTDFSDLPCFGGEEPSDTENVWSWDERRLLVGTCPDDMEIVPRTGLRHMFSSDFWFDAIWSEYDRAVCDGAMLPEGVTTGDIESIRAAFREGLSEFVKRYMKEES